MRQRAGGVYAIHDGQGELVDVVNGQREAFGLAAEVLEREQAVERQRQAEEQRVREEQVRAEEEQEKAAREAAEQAEGQDVQTRGDTEQAEGHEEQGPPSPQKVKQAQKRFIKYWDAWPKEVRGQFAALHGFRKGFSKKFERLDAELQHGLLQTALDVDAARQAWNKASVEVRKRIATEGGIAPYALATHLSDLPSKRWEGINPNLWEKLMMGHRIREGRREEAAAIRKDNKLRIENLSDDALWDLMQEGETEAVRKAAERELNKRMQREIDAEAAGDYEDLLSVLRKIKLPTKDGGLQAELDMLRKEGVNFGTHMHLFDKGQKSLDRVAEILRVDYGFGQIQTPDDVITFTERALSGEKIMPRLDVSELPIGIPSRPRGKDLGMPQVREGERYTDGLAEGHERFFHGSSAGLSQVDDSGIFGGIFASANYDSAASHGSKVFAVDVPSNEVASKWDIMNAPEEVLDKVYMRTIGKDWREHADLLEAVVEEDKDVFDYDEAEVLDALGETDLGDAGWRAQYIRGQIAKEMGFKAVPMKDEHGASYLILPGVPLRRVSELRAQSMQQVREDLSVAPEGVSQAEAKEQLDKLRGKLLRNDQTGIEAQINTNQAGKLLSNTAARKSENNGFTREQHNALVANIEKLWRHAIQTSEHVDERSGDGKTTIKRFTVPVLIGGDLKHATILAKERLESGHRIYTLEAIQKETLQGALGNSFVENGSKLTPLEALLREEVSAFRRIVKNDSSSTAQSNTDTSSTDVLGSPLQPNRPNAARVSFEGEAALKGKKPVSSTEVLNAIAKVAEAVGRDKRSVNRVGRLSSRSSLGTYNPGSRLTRIRTANDTTTAAHELAHLIDDALWGRDFWKKRGLPVGDPIMLGENHWKSNALNLSYSVRGELRTLGEQLYTRGEPHNGYHSEGFAEFVRLWLTDTEQAKQKAPSFAKWFEAEVLGKHPQLAGAVEQASALAHRFLAQGSVARGLAGIVKQPSHTQAAVTAVTREASDFRRKWLEAGVAIEDMAKEAQQRWREQKHSEMPNALDPFQAFKAYRMSADAIVEDMAMHGMVDAGRNRTGVAPLKDAFKLVGTSEGQLDKFMVYLWARRSLALHYDPRNGPRNSGLDIRDAEQILEELGSPQFERASGIIYAWGEGLLDYVAEHSPALDEMVARIRAVDPGSYIPLKREFAELDRRYAASGGGSAARAQLTKRLRGSGRRIKHPVESMIAQAKDMVHKAHQRRVIDQVLHLARTVKGLGHYAVEVPVDRVPLLQRPTFSSLFSNTP